LFRLVADFKTGIWCPFVFIANKHNTIREVIPWRNPSKFAGLAPNRIFL
jgi:hypothetical protein